MKYLYLLSIYFIWSQGTFAGTETGNGGDAIVCRKKGEISSVEFYDLFEARVVRSIIPKDMGSEDLTHVEKAEILIKRIAIWDEFRAKKYEEWLEDFKTEKNIHFSKNILNDIPDSGDTLVPPGCKLEQIVQFTPRKFPSDKEYVIRVDLWNVMDSLNKAALILHEFVYRELRFENAPIPHENSIRTRFFNSKVIGLGDNLTQKEYVESLSQALFVEYKRKNFSILLNTKVSITCSRHEHACKDFALKRNGQRVRLTPSFYQSSKTIKTAHLKSSRVYQGDYKINFHQSYNSNFSTSRQFSKALLTFDKNSKLIKIWTPLYLGMSLESKSLSFGNVFEVLFKDNVIQKASSKSPVKFKGHFFFGILKSGSIKSTNDFIFSPKGQLVGSYKIEYLDFFRFDDFKVIHKTCGHKNYCAEFNHKADEIVFNNQGLVEKFCLDSDFVGGKRCFVSGKNYKKYNKSFDLIPKVADMNWTFYTENYLTLKKAKKKFLNHCEKRRRKMLNLFPELKVIRGPSTCRKSMSCEFSKFLDNRCFGRVF